MAEPASRQAFETGRKRQKPLPPPETTNYPVREYVAALATELATMARWDGDERLASALDAAADMARRQAPAT